MHNVVFISAVQQSESVIYIYILFHILFHYGSPQDTEYSSLCCTVRTCCLSILYTKSAFANPRLPILPSPYPSLATTSPFSISVSLFLFCRYVDLCHILDSTCK